MRKEADKAGTLRHTLRRTCWDQVISDATIRTTSGLENLAKAGKGSYALLIWLDRNVVVCSIHGAKRWHLEAGLQVYTGSALGPGGLQARLKRHLRPNRRLHWHVDALLAHGTICGFLGFSRELDECELAKVVASTAKYPIIGFGCSDCRCVSHLYYLGESPIRSGPWIERLLSAAPARCAVIWLSPRL